MRWLLGLFAFVSGGCALIYEVAWVRVLSVDFGTTVYAISTVLTVFMGGLALGSHLFGRRIDRSPNPLRVYAGLEIALGLYALLFVAAVPHLHAFTGWLLADRASLSPGSLAVKFGISVLLLLPPCTLMGGTLPVLAKSFADSKELLGLWLGTIYGVNTLGAVAGCLAEAYILILVLGVTGSILLASGLNGLIGLAAAVLAGRAQLRGGLPTVPPRIIKPGDLRSGAWAGQETRPQLGETRPQLGETRPQQAHENMAPGPELIDAAPTTIEDLPYAPPSQALLMAVAFGSGFVTLAAQILWNRLLINLLTGNVLVFATVLAAFLTGISLGSLVISRRVDRWQRLDVALGSAMLVGAAWLTGSVLGQTLLGDLFAAIHTLDLQFSSAATAYVSLGALFVVVLLPASAFGAVVPLVLRWGSRSLHTLGSDVGRILVANTIGAIAGSFVAGFLLISLVGVNAGLLPLAAGYGLLAMIVFRPLSLRVISLAAACGCLTLIAVPDVRRPVFWFNGGFTCAERIPESETLFLQEGAEGTVGVSSQDGILSLSVNGVTVAESTRRDLWDLLLKAHLPMLLHENPKRVAIVGLGAGISLGATTAYDVERIDCIELQPDVVPAHKMFAAFNERSWQDPRVHIRIDDGRHFLQTTSLRYDVINVDPIDPPVCNQYTEDFIRLCHDRLNPGGLMVQWVPLFHLAPVHVQTIMRAFINVFPQSTLWYDGTSVLLIGRRGEPLEFDVERFLQRAERAQVQESLALIGRPHPLILLSTYVAGPEAIHDMIPTDVPENTDERPYLEFALLLAGRLDSQTIAANLEMFVPHFVPGDTWLIVPEWQPGERERFLQVRELMYEFLRVRIDSLRRDYDRSEQRMRRATIKYDLQENAIELYSPFFRD